METPQPSEDEEEKDPAEMEVQEIAAELARLGQSDSEWQPLRRENVNKTELENYSLSSLRNPVTKKQKKRFRQLPWAW